MFASVAHALGVDPARVELPVEEQGTITGEGLRGTFHVWRAGDREREDQVLGLRLERTLRIGDRMWEQDENGAVRELRGTLRRRALTSAYIDSGAFTGEPDRARYLGTGSVGGRPTFRVEVSAPGGDPEQIDIDPQRWLPVRLQYVQGDGVVSIDLGDWRTVAGEAYSFQSTISNGTHAYDLVETLTRVVTGADIAPYVFAPLVARTIDAPAVQTVKLGERNAHFYCIVWLNDRPYRFLLDTGAQGLVLDRKIAGELGLVPQGSMQAYGAARTGGLGLVRVADLRIGTAHLRDVVVATLPLEASTGGMLHLDGILGSSFFAAATVMLNFPALTMTFGVPGSFEPAGARIALDTDREVPEATLTFNGTRSAPFIIDTGNSGTLLLYRPFVDANPGVVPFTGESRTSFGIGGTTSEYETTLAELQLGDRTYSDVPTRVVLSTEGAFADRFDAGNVGLGILRDSVVTFDETNAAMYVHR